MNDNNNKVSVPIAKTIQIAVPNNHSIAHLILEDKRELFVSPNHPTADNRLCGKISSGDILDNSKVVKAKLISYEKEYVCDILPAGKTGLYWTNGILLKSTL